MLGAYRFDTYKKDSAEDAKQPGDWVVLSSIARQGEATAAFERAQLLAAGVNAAREWVNLPANDLNPPTMADAIVAQHKEVTKGRGAPKIDIQVWDEKAARRRGLRRHPRRRRRLGASPPRMVKLTWAPEGATKHVAIIGKGITYDSGGYTIKPPASMLHMKEDMAGAAAVGAGDLPHRAARAADRRDDVRPDGGEHDLRRRDAPRRRAHHARRHHRRDDQHRRRGPADHGRRAGDGRRGRSPT